MSTRPAISASSFGTGHLCTVNGAHCQRVWQRTSTMSSACLHGPCRSVQYSLRQLSIRQRRPGNNVVLENSILGRSVHELHRPQLRKDFFLKTSQRRAQPVRASIGPELGSTDFDVVGALGLDTLTFLAATVIVVPTFRSFKISPVRIPWQDTSNGNQLAMPFCSSFFEDL